MTFRILHVITGLGTGGAETMLHKLCVSLDRSRYQPYVLSLSGGGPLQDRLLEDGVSVQSIDLRHFRRLPHALAAASRHVGSIRPHVIQGWLPHGNLAALAAAAATRGRIPLVWSIRQSLDLESQRDAKRSTATIIRMGARLSRWPDVVIYNSRAGMKHHQALGYRTSASITIPNGFDLERFGPRGESRAEVRAELGLPDHTLVVGMVARFHSMKDHASFLKAAATLSRRVPDVAFILIGRGVTLDNPDFRELVRQVGAPSRLFALGERLDIPRLTAAFDIATSSSRTLEGFPNAIGEAMACAIPCVVTDVGDSAYVVGDTGVVVPPNDATSLAAAWEGMLQMPAAGRRELGDAARKRIQDNFSLEAIAEQYALVYDKLLAS